MEGLLKVLSVLVPLAVGYATWLGTVTEAPYERRTRVRRAVEGKKFSSGELTIRAGRVTFSEKKTYRYKFRKLIPTFRRLDGETVVRLHSDGGEISIRADGFGPTEYLDGALKTTTRLKEGHPHFECDRNYGEDETVKLRIESWEVSPILELLEGVPAHLHETLDNYPGESEYRFKSQR
ncbi:hypothetical protein KU306_01130 [Haloferax larsenii]|uniref:DUF4178 domain-containing protein n=1 Tax=Haloferax larsenii TaxID=302484 RepID=A0ABY5RHB5_HALLR|nr:hypothetical protein [Haloferax larsenii]UVE50540.1 hypothetical protein KU306_01130 [Haloferax larsenii]